jgi:hyperosmotically inducible periplasmic protein
MPILAVCPLLCALGSAPVIAQDRAPAPDNTRVNKQTAPTADQATNAKTDRELMQQIRKSLVDDKSLSTYAHNVKVIASHGKVTLKGPVNSEEEKRAVEKKAEEVAGAENVTSEITIKAARSKK